MRSRLADFVFVLAAWGSTTGAAQINSGEIAGVVRDPSGGVLPGAVVTATHVATGATVERTTDGEAILSSGTRDRRMGCHRAAAGVCPAPPARRDR